MPLKYIGSLLVTLGVLVLGVMAMMLVAVILSLITSVDMAPVLEFLQQSQAGNVSEIPNMSGLGVFLLVMLAGFYVISVFAAHVFNFWVNLAAYGRDAARWSLGEGRLSAALVNGLKFMLIGVLVGVVQLVTVLVLVRLGLVPGFAEQAAITSYSEAILSGLTGSIFSVVITSGIYSLFSANLTQTALQSDAEGMDHPHTVDFAIVLVLLYAIYTIPTILAALSGSDVLTWTASIVLGLYLVFTIPVAHGLRYRVCVASPGDEG